MSRNKAKKTLIRTTVKDAVQGGAQRRSLVPMLPIQLTLTVVAPIDSGGPQVNWPKVDEILDSFKDDAETAFKRATNNRLAGTSISLGGSLLVLAVLPQTLALGLLFVPVLAVGRRYFRTASEFDQNAREIKRLVMELKANLLVVESSGGLSEQVVLSLLEQTKMHAALRSENPVAHGRALRAGLQDVLMKTVSKPVRSDSGAGTEIGSYGIS